ncbi:MAG TPA: aminotransferase class I/II-fold pyridoxal phosphate-dependent enzyme [Thermoplasmata archaeon]|nr:aminotransferase class I/II-fold pyridoxal phosphate-dependent enzyme [Thermoplasmata archaeon]
MNASSPGTVPAAGRRFRPLPEWAGAATRLVHGGTLPDLNAGAVIPPVYLTSTFRYPAAFSEARERGDVHLYSREGNPTVEGPAELLRQLEGGEAARLFASGMGAIAGTILSLVRSGDTVVASDTLYGGTVALLRETVPGFGVRVRWLNSAEAAEPESSITGPVRLAVVETPTNPTLRVLDLRRWAEATHRAGGLLLVDNTFASPINQRPIALGADLVVHSATKYLGGHSDLIAGALVGSAPLLARIDPKHHLGAPLDPFVAFLLHRSLKTLQLRVERQNRSGAAVVAALEREPGVLRVDYPGRASPAEEAIAARQMCGRGGMLALTLEGGRPVVARFLEALRIFDVAASLGGVESLVSVPRETSHRVFSDEELAARGISDGMVRLSLGIEETEDLVRDLREAIAHARGSPSPPL